MKFFTAASFFALATAVAAAPSYNQGTPSVTKEQAIAKCGNSNISCCNKQVNKISAKGPDTDIGVLNGLLKNVNLEDIPIFDQCSKLNIAALGATDLLNRQCQQTAACCQNTESNANGVVALAVPCIPINIL
ncbi:hypothetical protein D8B26_006156 [Coccidioides posadasii str. Silveira]|uniref:Hydrophobin n=3 Tax=Coccidioides posadasii TaxID=199306 RepID=E9DBH0_COCPS|nr:Fungal hydrophobin family protein [Coccidioides posadasii C735 delta SOWgp]EER27741.1 Fungal hydrophobin family protein [Coccidioides posadasii C735 delta SOWgp]EFW16122.1 conserved hypothetical protein [Coccidioides posadasii str. Silveira]KMM67647.1 hypothetical protein CPAG_03980 [Coccidioides posadasii RMSCC 3488]QVM11509.1 hypothetical protein D8B26_006156 [Coccidioides posadasii str. Silveira]|eukprot:XP_003069886.1 Fungal hydrophobin family protein [Coccidioides posadasii C735 delta SOWgp]